MEAVCYPEMFIRTYKSLCLAISYLTQTFFLGFALCSMLREHCLKINDAPSPCTIKKPQTSGEEVRRRCNAAAPPSPPSSLRIKSKSYSNNCNDVNITPTSDFRMSRSYYRWQETQNAKVEVGSNGMMFIPNLMNFSSIMVMANFFPCSKLLGAV